MPRASRADLPLSARIVVIGGGIIGASIAFHLAEAGCPDVLLLDAGEFGGESSGKPIGGVRAQFSDALNITLASRSLRAYERFASSPGADISLDQVGYLFLLRTPEQLAAFEASIALQNELGVPARLLAPGEARALNPYIDPDVLIGAAFSPGDGHARPAAAVTGYVEAAHRRGVRLATRCPVTGMDVRGGEIAAIHTARGTVRTSLVICAAGAWSREIGAMAGVELDVRPIRRQIAFVEAPSLPAARVPFTIDHGSTFYFHNAGDELLVGWSDAAQVPGYDRDYTADWMPQLRRLAAEHAPGLGRTRVTGGWAGLYESTPDANALIGESATVSRFLYATGFSGHGFCHAPAVGEVVRDLVRGERPFVDVSPLRAERFAENAPIVESNIV